MSEIQIVVTVWVFYPVFSSQVNTLPAYIDSSQIYGGSEEIQQRERDLNPDVGRLLERPHPAGPGLRGLLPVMTNGTCRSPNPFIFPCFRSGDERTNENQGTVCHVGGSNS